jgi:2,3-bisphosphoglycerate-independent phosphoglycerate mutase
LGPSRLGEKVRPLVLVILDGWGIAPKSPGNAITQANLPTMTQLWNSCPHTTLNASNGDVGLPEGIMGNSEVGHLNMGAGRVVMQDLVRINKSIADGEFFKSPVLLEHMQKARRDGKTIHFMGLLSDGGVHSDIGHLYALLELAKRLDCSKVWVHAFLDGRDTPPRSAQKYIVALEQKIVQLKVGRIATVMGRYYAMDRDCRWDRTAKAYYAITQAQGLHDDNAVDALKEAYGRDEGDEFVLPTVIEGYGGFEENDLVVFYNFRSDRPRQLVQALYQPDFKAFDRKTFYDPDVVCMTEYDKTFHLPTVFPPMQLNNRLGQYLSKLGLRQLRIAETEKYAHVTFFFNGGVEVPNPGEDRILVNSPKVATYDLKPEMSAGEVTDKLVEQICSKKYDFILVNYANPDMVAHTASMAATIKALEYVDSCLARVLAAVKSSGGLCVVCSDHGHAEQLLDYATGGPWTAHTLNPVPFIVVTDKTLKLRSGRLGDVAPTVLQLMGLTQPKEMTGYSLIES